MKWLIGKRVQVSLPYGEDGLTVLEGTIARIQDPGPNRPERTVKVLFDDPLVFGGTGTAWVRPEVLSEPGAAPAPPDREA